MKVSIVTAVRNGATEIARTLQSVAAQRFASLEHIVIDGASTDDTVETVKRHGARVSVLISESDRGVYDAFNKGLQRCTGELIGFLNCGDRYVDENVIAKLVDRLQQQEASAVFADLEIFEPVSQRIVRRYRSSAFTPAKIGFGYMPAHPTLFVRREIYERYGGYDPSYRIAGDFDFVARTFGCARISYAYLPETIVYMADGGVSNRGWRSKWTITREMRRACRSNGIRSGWARLLLRLPVKYVTESLRVSRP